MGEFRKSLAECVSVILAVACLIPAGLAGELSRFELIRNGSACCCIENSSDVVLAGDIAFFTNAVFRMTGVALPVISGKADPSSAKIVFPLKSRSIASEDEGAIGFPDDRTLCIAGSANGCRWVLNRMLESWGVVFCFPGSAGTHYPRCADLSLLRKEGRTSAGLKYARDLYGENSDWLRALCGKVQPGNFFNHNVYAIFPVSKYAKEPWLSKIMPEVNGVRKRPKAAEYGWQPCYASAEGVAEAIRNVCAYFDRHPDRKVWSLSVNDHNGYCRCEACKRLNGGTFPLKCRFDARYECHSESYYTWVNQVAAGVIAKHPDVTFGVLAYCGTIDPPSFKLHPSVVPFLCCDTYQLRDENVVKRRKALFAAWSEKAEAFGVWDYAYGCRHYLAPRLYLRTVSDFFAWKREFPKLQGFFMEGSNFIGEGPKRYLYAKLAADPAADPGKILDKWYRACCGAAAAEDLKAYYDIWERFWDKDVLRSHWYKTGLGAVYMDFAARDYVFCISSETIAEATRRMERVVAAARKSGDSDQIVRAEALKSFHGLTLARLDANGFGCARADGTLRTAADAVRFFGRFPAVCAAQDRLKGKTEEVLALSTNLFGQTFASHCKTFLKSADKSPNINRLLNFSLDFIADPGVRAALETAATDARTPERWRKTLRGLARPCSVGDNPADSSSLSDEADLAAWREVDHQVAVDALPRGADGARRYRMTRRGDAWPAPVKCVSGLVPGHDYRYRVRIRNTASCDISCSLIFLEERSERAFCLKKGGSLDISVLGTASGKNARLYVVLEGLRKGESVEVDSISLTDLSADASVSGNSYRFFNIVPYSPGFELEQAARMREYCARTGNDLVLYSLTLHPEGKPAWKKVDEAIGSFRAFRKALEGSGVRAGVLIQSILGHWVRTDRDIEPWQRSIDIDGRITRFCPFDPAFAEYIERVGLALANERPAFVLTDDDLRSFFPKAECFCPLHVAEYNRRAGTSFTADGLRAAVRASRPGDTTYEAFVSLQHDTICRAAALLRKGLDSVMPPIPAGVCQSGLKGDVETPRISAPAMAAKGQDPVARLAAMKYLERTSLDLPGFVGRWQLNTELNGAVPVLLDEADTCPHNLWSKSATAFHAKLVCGIFAGFSGAKIWYVNALRLNDPIPPSYTDVLAGHLGYYSACVDAVRSAERAGVAIPYPQDVGRWHPAHDPECLPFEDPNWGVSIAGHFGIPFFATTNLTRDAVYALSGADAVDAFADADLRTLLSRRILVDGPAAARLSARGFADLLGVRVAGRPPIFNRERTKGGRVLALAPSHGFVPAFEPLEDTEEVSALEFTPFSGSQESERVAPACVRFRNALGGTVLTTAFHPRMDRMRLLTPSRCAWFAEMLSLLGETTPFVAADRDVMTLAMRAQDGSVVLNVVNLNFDPMNVVELRNVSEGTTVEVLERNGGWHELAGTVKGGRLALPVVLPCYGEMVFRIRMPHV